MLIASARDFESGKKNTCKDSCNNAMTLKELLQRINKFNVITCFVPSFALHN
ncbi:hypothetical protein OESDEN_19932 [Oesophagostomum dentatum]|uniref:Uncharacterized protein n=1 Tax=Oesophagostomum dentatum TaxID=61180 RepID=A0A0B1S4W4_OESDE|nr:hypothetical protein OESDEN_19932 [Oesophagostomum dentatum]